MKRLQAKVAIITGAGSGIGAATARLFAEEGASVVVTDISEGPIRALAEEMSRGGHRAIHRVLDVTSEEQWGAAVRSARDTFGRVDILVNNAGISGRPASWAESTVADFHQLIAINLTGSFLGIYAVRPVMEAQGGGAIVNVSSIAAFIAFPNTQPGYTASKGGTRLLTKSAAVDFAPKSIRANAVCPGGVDTPLNHYITKNPETLKHVNAKIPMNRMAEPIEIARAILFLASDDASYITGTELLVDGGLTAT